MLDTSDKAGWVSCGLEDFPDITSSSPEIRISSMLSDSLAARADVSLFPKMTCQEIVHCAGLFGSRDRSGILDGTCAPPLGMLRLPPRRVPRNPYHGGGGWLDQILHGDGTSNSRPPGLPHKTGSFRFYDLDLAPQMSM